MHTTFACYYEDFCKFAYTQKTFCAHSIVFLHTTTAATAAAPKSAAFTVPTCRITTMTFKSGLDIGIPDFESRLGGKREWTTFDARKVVFLKHTANNVYYNIYCSRQYMA